MTTVECPVCAKEMPGDAINEHLDRSCTLARSPKKPRPSSSTQHANASDWTFMTQAQERTPATKAKGSSKKRKVSKSDTKTPFTSHHANDNDSDSDLEIIPTQSKKKKSASPTHKKTKNDIPPAPIFVKTSQNTNNNLQKAQPLAERSRPTTLDGYVGQEDLMGEDGILRSMILSDTITSCIFWGPPGSGKTTLARIIAQSSDAKLRELSATNTGVGEAKQILDQARSILKLNGTRTILFVDEVHRYSKLQQDVFL